MAYKECSCINPEIEIVLREAINNLKSLKLGDTEKQAHEREEQLKEPMEALAKLSSKLPSEQIQSIRDQILSSLPISDEEKKFLDIEKWIESCKCDSSTVFNWRTFPYGSTVQPATGTRKPFTKKVANLPTDELEAMTSKIRGYNQRFKAVLDNPLYYSELKNKYPNEQDITAGNVRKSLVEFGIMSSDEYKEWNELNNTYRKAGGADLIFQADNDFLNIRKAKQLQVTPKSEAFKTKK